MLKSIIGKILSIIGWGLAVGPATDKATTIANYVSGPLKIRVMSGHRNNEVTDLLIIL